MFERFTDRAKQVVVLAQTQASLLNHNYIGTEHLLLGLIEEGEGVAAQTLERLNISLELARAEVEEMIGRGGAPAAGHIPFTPRAKKVLELSLREALQLGHNHIGTEHLLLGLIREGEGVAAQVLVKLGADLDRVRAQVLELLEVDEPAPARYWRRARGASPTVDPPSDDPIVLGPTCPNCKRLLEDFAAVRRLNVADEGGEDVEIRVIYCRSCGRTLGTSID